MTAWAVRGVELPFGEEIASWWIDASGSIHDRPVASADLLPGGFILPGLVDAHAHPAVGSGPAGLVALDEDAARATLIAWARAGVTLVRDVGSPGGVILELTSGPGMPVLQAAGRFLAPAGRYFPDLLGAPVAEAGLVSAALAEIGRGAGWVKVIADFPDLAAGTDAEATYRIEATARLVAAAHEAGARVAVHSTVPGAGELVAAGVDSVEHGFGLDERAIRDMAGRGTAWTPTLGALLALLDAPGMAPGRRRRLWEGLARVTELLPLAVRLGVPVLAGRHRCDGVDPRGGGAAGTDGARAARRAGRNQYLASPVPRRRSYRRHRHLPSRPPRGPGQLAHPAAVVAGGSRLR